MGEALQKTLATLQKTYGMNAVARVKDIDSKGVEFLSSGSIGINHALGGGYAKGRIIELYGPESSGKTTLTLHAIAECQKEGGTVAFIDVEHSLDLKYAEDLGVDIDDLILSQPETAEEVFETVEGLARSGEVHLIVVDSVAAMLPKRELEGDVGDAVVGVHAKLMSQGMKKLKKVLKDANCPCIFINQIRMKIGVLFGSPETTPGGTALKFYASQRIEIRSSTQHKDNKENKDEVTSRDSVVKVVKNKVGRPYRKVVVEIGFGKGINIFSEVVEIGVGLDIIEKAGSWYSYNGTKIGQGITTVKELLEDNPELFDEISERINIQLFGPDEI